MDVAARDWGAAGPPDLLIGSDTVVEHGGRILEKPADAEEAARVLRSLSGARHRVHSGVALVLPGQRGAGGGPLVRSFSMTTTVEFDELSDRAIRAYVATGEPMDKAGSYGIQGPACQFVRGIEGCYFNVMGFPVHRFAVEVGGLVEGGLL